MLILVCDLLFLDRILISHYPTLSKYKYKKYEGEHIRYASPSFVYVYSHPNVNVAVMVRLTCNTSCIHDNRRHTFNTPQQHAHFRLARISLNKYKTERTRRRAWRYVYRLFVDICMIYCSANTDTIIIM